MANQLHHGTPVPEVDERLPGKLEKPAAGGQDVGQGGLGRRTLGLVLQFLGRIIPILINRR